jgi:hypothetical protein
MQTSFQSAVTYLAFTALSHPQTALAGLHKSLQQEWQFFQRVIDGIGDDLAPIEEAISNLFLPDLFGDSIECNYRHKSQTSGAPSQERRPSPPNPIDTSGSSYKVSMLVCSHILEAFRGTIPFSSTDHKSVRASVTIKLKLHSRTELNETALTLVLDQLDCNTHRTIKQGTETGQWLSVLPFTIKGTKLSVQEFWDALLLRYDRSPGDLQSQCDGCDTTFSVRHTLECKTGGLIILQHNEITKELCHLASKALTPSMICLKPMIKSGVFADYSKAVDPKSPVQRLRLGDEEQGDLLIRGFWTRGIDAIIDVHMTNMDAKSYKFKDPHKVLAQHEKEKKRKYLASCVVHHTMQALHAFCRFNR